MKRFPCRISDARHVVATIMFVAVGAVSSAAQTPMFSPVPAPESPVGQADAAAKAESRPCPPADEIAVRVPGSIKVSDDLLPRIHAMLEKSATFRSQCRRIAEAPRLHVRVKLDMGLTGRTYRATTKICRQPSGAIVAAVDIAPFGDPAEWLAHEFEHLIEQLDGVDLRDLERRRLGVWRSGDQMFETERAVRVGRQVHREMREPAIAAQLGDRAVVDLRPR